MTKKTRTQELFLSNTTRLGFKLTLSTAMMEFLCATSDGVQWDRALYRSLWEPDNWIATERALTRRGLVERLSVKEMDALRKKKETAYLPYRLTPIGVAVVEMLKAGGLFVEAKSVRLHEDKKRG